MPPSTEKQTVLNTHREAHGYKRTHTGTSPDKHHTWMDTHRHASTRIPRNTRILAPHAATDTLKNTTVRGFAVLLGARTQRHATLSPDPRDSPVAQPRPSQAAPLLLSLLHLRLKTYKTLLRINPGSRLLPPRPAAVAPPFIFARRRVSPSPRVARPPLLPARRPRRTWTSLSIRSPPRSRSPRLRTDLARGGGGKRRRTND